MLKHAFAWQTGPCGIINEPPTVWWDEHGSCNDTAIRAMQIHTCDKVEGRDMNVQG